MPSILFLPLVKYAFCVLEPHLLEYQTHPSESTGNFQWIFVGTPRIKNAFSPEKGVFLKKYVRGGAACSKAAIPSKSWRNKTIDTRISNQINQIPNIRTKK